MILFRSSSISSKKAEMGALENDKEPQHFLVLLGGKREKIQTPTEFKAAGR